MKKILICLFVIFFSLICVFIYGYETTNLNAEVSTEFNKKFPKISLEFKSIRINLDPKNIAIRFSLIDPKLFYKKKLTTIYQSNFEINLLTLLRGNKDISFLELKFSENSIADSADIIKDVFFNTNQKFILDNKIKNGTISGDVKITFDREIDYKFEGVVSNLNFIIDQNFPEFQNINAIINIKNETITTQILSGDLAGLNFSKSKISVLSNDSGYKADLDLNLSGQLQSFKDFKNIQFLKDFNYTNSIDELSFGIKSSNKINLQFDKNGNLISNTFKGKADLENLHLHINKSKFSNIFEDNNRFFSNGKFKLDYDQSSTTINGIIFNQNDYFNIDILTDDKNNTKFNIISELNFSNWSKVFNSKYIKGSIKSYIQVILDKDKVYFEVKSNLKKSYINFYRINYIKLLNNEADFTLKGKFSNNDYLIDNILFESNKNKINISNLDLDNNFLVKSFKLIELYTRNNSLNIAFSKNNNSNIIEILGRKLDATNLIESLTSSNSSSIISKQFSGLLSVKLDTIVTGANDDIHDFILSGTVAKGMFTKLSGNGNFSDKEKINIKIGRNKNNYIETYLHSDRARPFFSSFSFIKGFEKGKLDFRSEDVAQDISRGSIIVSNFQIREVPLLAKILSLTSLTGIYDTIRGKGIRFDNAVLTFKNDKNNFIIEDFYGTGPAIGFILNGSISNIDKSTKINGNIIPAYEVNRVIGMLPVVGDILAGKTGDGIFGISFTIKGKEDDLDVEINPVKTLTPRFVQRFIKMFRSPKVNQLDE